MFEPENDIERLLMRASNQPSERRSFMRALMDAEVFVVLVSDGAPLVPGPDGTRAVGGNILKGRMLDAMPLDAGSLSVTLRGGIPILTSAPKRGFLQKLFR